MYLDAALERSKAEDELTSGGHDSFVVGNALGGAHSFAGLLPQSSLEPTAEQNHEQQVRDHNGLHQEHASEEHAIVQQQEVILEHASPPQHAMLAIPGSGTTTFQTATASQMMSHMRTPLGFQDPPMNLPATSGPSFAASLPATQMLLSQNPHFFQSALVQEKLKNTMGTGGGSAKKVPPVFLLSPALALPPFVRSDQSTILYECASDRVLPLMLIAVDHHACMCIATDHCATAHLFV